VDIVLDPAFANELGIASLLPSKATLDTAHIPLEMQNAGSGIGGGGAVSVVPFIAKRVQLGDAVVNDVRGLYTPEGTPFGAFPFTVGALVSHQFLAHFAVTFDFVSMRLVLVLD